MKTIYFIAIISLLAISCEKESGNDYKVLNTVYMENKELFNCVTCFSVVNIHARSGFVIKDNYTYKLYADSMRIHPLNSNCDTATLINIDFNKYSLIGIMTAIGGCDSISKAITVDHITKETFYNVHIAECIGQRTEILYLPLNLALISKIPDNYKVEFTVNRN